MEANGRTRSLKEEPVEMQPNGTAGEQNDRLALHQLRLMRLMELARLQGATTTTTTTTTTRSITDLHSGNQMRTSNHGNRTNSDAKLYSSGRQLEFPKNYQANENNFNKQTRANYHSSSSIDAESFKGEQVDFNGREQRDMKFRARSTSKQKQEQNDKNCDRSIEILRKQAEDSNCSKILDLQANLSYLSSASSSGFCSSTSSAESRGSSSAKNNDDYTVGEDRYVVVVNGIRQSNSKKKSKHNHDVDAVSSTSEDDSLKSDDRQSSDSATPTNDNNNLNLAPKFSRSSISYLKTTPTNDELGYSTLCRDEFSSFISGNDITLTNDENRVLMNNNNHHDHQIENNDSLDGPTLIGTHDELSGSDSLEESGKEEIFELPSSRDKRPKVDPLDVYIKRVECLLRLSRGDRTVTMDEAFGCNQNEELEPDKRLEFTPLQQRLPKGFKVIQETQLSLMDNDDDDDILKLIDGQDRFEIHRNVLSDNFVAMLNVPQIEPKLNWSLSSDDCDRSQISSKVDLDKLRSSLMNSFKSLFNERKWRNQTNRDCLVKIVDEQLNDFIENYLSYRSKLKTSGGSIGVGIDDWRKNWLFSNKSLASYDEENIEANGDKEENEDPDRFKKRAKIELSQNEMSDLMSYSTLLKSKKSPLLFSSKDDSITIEALNDPIVRLYDKCNDLDEQVTQRRGQEYHKQVDACKLLLSDDFNDVDPMNDYEYAQNIEGKRKRKVRSKKIDVLYESSCLLSTTSSNSPGVSASSNPGHQFSAYGYSFKLFDYKIHLSNQPSKVARLRDSVLNQFGQIFNTNANRNSNIEREYNDIDEHVGFSIKLSNVELINPLSTIQFCAKIKGSLPIKVSWFRLLEPDELINSNQASSEIEISDAWRPDLGQVKIKRVDLGPHCGEQQSNWPIGLRANYEFEYQTDWSSWFRFRRSQNDILFEIRKPNDKLDYNRNYKCVIENYCSRQECKFRLTRKDPSKLLSEDLNSKLSKLNKISRLKEKSHLMDSSSSSRAILRTWSQRTLNKPACSTTSVDFNGLIEGSSLQVTSANNSKEVNSKGEEMMDDNKRLGSDYDDTMNRRTTTLKSMSKVKAGKIDENFPYHPENLLKRLNENKYSMFNIQNVHGLEKNYQIELEFLDPQELTNVTRDEDKELVAKMDPENEQTTLEEEGKEIGLRNSQVYLEKNISEEKEEEACIEKDRTRLEYLIEKPLIKQISNGSTGSQKEIERDVNTLEKLKESRNLDRSVKILKATSRANDELAKSRFTYHDSRVDPELRSNGFSSKESQYQQPLSSDQSSSVKAQSLFHSQIDSQRSPNGLIKESDVIKNIEIGLVSGSSNCYSNNSYNNNNNNNNNGNDNVVADINEDFEAIKDPKEAITNDDSNQETPKRGSVKSLISRFSLA